VRIRSRIFLGYLLLAVLVVIVGLAGYRATAQVGGNFDRAINQTQPVLQALEEIRFHGVKLLLESHNSVHGVDHAENNGGSARLAQLDATLARYRILVARYFPQEAKKAGEIAEKIAGIRESTEKLATRGLPRATAEEIFHDLSHQVDELIESIDEAAEDELKEFADYQRGVDEQIAIQERIILTISTMALLSALLGGIYLSTRLARPVVALRDAAARLGKGDLGTRVAVGDSTEVGELAQAFNSMAEQLAGSMVSRDYVEDIIDSMHEGMIVVDAQGHVERVNHGFRSLFGCARDYSFEGHPIANYFPDCKLFGNPAGGPLARQWMEMEMRTANGERLIVAMSIAALHSEKAEAGVVVLVQDITERKQNEERLSYLARYDSLTGLPNRTLLLDHLRQSLARQPWKKELTAILFCDLDRFKFVNDTLGHGVGDILLQRVAERIQRCVRPGDIVARWAGDEFVVLLNDVSKHSDLQPLAEKVVAQLSEPIQVGPHELYVTISVGISVSPEHGVQADELVKCSDMAMYAAKTQGKNTYCFYAKGMAERSQERLVLEGALRRALQEGNQLQVHYQAQQRIGGALIGFEALVRWRHPELGLISPAMFLPTAEEAGLMAAIDETVLRTACEQAAQWQRTGVHGLRISVNVSDHLFRRGDLPRLVASLLDEYGLPAASLELELTEAIVMADIESSIHTMQRIRDLGVDLSIDDFGTGYSSLSHLKRCPIQMLKIDRSFVADVITDPNDAAITEAIVALAHKLGIQVIAEGVETQAQLEVLRGYDCDAMQGYLLSKPIPADDLPAFLARLGHAATSAALTGRSSADRSSLAAVASGAAPA
jgi:diguanylate cyclase (GGDEF)-like protein/PAS domain S-box-containing protein